MIGWFRRWRRTRARAATRWAGWPGSRMKSGARKVSRRRARRPADWDETTRYGDPDV
jgi:hypothetical protein